MDVGLSVRLFTNMPLEWLLPWMNVTSASTSDSSSEVELYLSSLNRGADDRELEVGGAGRGIWGVKGLCGSGGSIGAVASVLSAEVACGN